MNALIALDPEEIEALMEFHAGRIGQLDADEHGCDRACARIEHLRRISAARADDDIWAPAGALAQDGARFAA